MISFLKNFVKKQKTIKTTKENVVVNPTESFRRFCSENPWAVECKIYED